MKKSLAVVLSAGILALSTCSSCFAENSSAKLVQKKSTNAAIKNTIQSEPILPQALMATENKPVDTQASIEKNIEAQNIAPSAATNGNTENDKSTASQPELSEKLEKQVDVTSEKVSAEDAVEKASNISDNNDNKKLESTDSFQETINEPEAAKNLNEKDSDNVTEKTENKEDASEEAEIKKPELTEEQKQILNIDKLINHLIENPESTKGKELLSKVSTKNLEEYKAVVENNFKQNAMRHAFLMRHPNATVADLSYCQQVSAFLNQKYAVVANELSKNRQSWLSWAKEKVVGTAKSLTTGLVSGAVTGTVWSLITSLFYWKWDFSAIPSMALTSGIYGVTMAQFIPQLLQILNIPSFCAKHFPQEIANQLASFIVNIFPTATYIFSQLASHKLIGKYFAFKAEKTEENLSHKRAQICNAQIKKCTEKVSDGTIKLKNTEGCDIEATKSCLVNPSEYSEYAFHLAECVNAELDTSNGEDSIKLELKNRDDCFNTLLLDILNKKNIPNYNFYSDFSFKSNSQNTTTQQL